MTFINLFRNYNRKEQIVHIMMYLMGTCLLPAGTVLVVNSHCGAGGLDAMNFALGDVLHISVTIAIYGIGVIAMLLAAILRKSVPRIEVFVTSIIQGAFTGIWKNILADVSPASTGSAWLMFLLGNVLVAFMAAPYFLSALPANAMDDFTLALTEKKVRISIAKIGVEGVCAVIALLLHGEINIGTIVIVLSIGPLIDLFQVWLRKLLDKYGIRYGL